MDALALLTPAARDNRGVLTRTQTLALGVSQRSLTDLVSRGSVARIARGVYAIGETLPDPRRVAAAWRAVISYESAVAWHGVELPAPLQQLHVTVPRRRAHELPAVPGIRLHRSDLARREVDYVNGTLVTTPLRTAVDIARRAPIADAVAVADAFIRSRHFTLTDFIAAATAAKGPGRLRIQTVASLVEPVCGSVLESLTRVMLWREGLPAAVSQLSLKSPATGWVGCVDFGWPELQSVLECDGYQANASRDHFCLDRRRWSAIAASGWGLAVVTWFDVTQDPAYVVALVRRLLGLDTTQDAGLMRVAS
jgi:hypothetical protein